MSFRSTCARLAIRCTILSEPLKYVLYIQIINTTIRRLVKLLIFVELHLEIGRLGLEPRIPYNTLIGYLESFWNVFLLWKETISGYNTDMFSELKILNNLFSFGAIEKRDNCTFRLVECPLDSFRL